MIICLYSGRWQVAGGKVKFFEDLQVWQKSMDFVVLLYQCLERFPKSEMYGLTSQLKRCAISVPSNIAEGSAKRSTKEFLRFIDIAAGSIAEIQTQLMLAKRLNYLSIEEHQTLRNAINEIGRMLKGLEKALQQKETA